MADVPGKFFKATKVRTGVSPSSPGVIEGETLPPLNPPGGSLNSVGLSMPSAFNVANSPLTSNGTLAVTGAGTVGQYIRGDGSLADFPQASGGGSSVSYYLNGSVNQGTIGGVAYRELSKVPILGAGTDFTINADGYIASFITDAGDPNLLEIPGGNWNFETYFSASSSGGTPTFYVELYKYDGTTFTLIASSSTSPEFIAFGTNLTPYYSTLAVPTTTLALTDRLAIRYYVTHSGRTITLHTENNHLCQIVTTFTTGITALNGLTAQVQNFAVGTSGTDFNIASATATHTFNLPTASATNRGALSSADWSLFRQAYNDKINSASVTGTTTKTLTLVQQDGGEIQASWSDLNTDAVTSVFGRTGAVVAVSGDYNTSQVTESGNLYFTQARVSANTDVAANTAARHNAVTLGTANGLSLSTQQLSLGLASGSTTGALSSTDWNTFNNKENAITAGTTAQYFRGDKTFQTLNTAAVPESGNLYFTNARAIASTLTGYVSGAGTISSADSILTAIQKLNGNIGGLTTGVSSVFGRTGAVVAANGDYYLGTTAIQSASANQAITGITGITFVAHVNDSASITSTISGTSTFFDFNLSDDNLNDEWRWRFTPSGASVYNAMRLVPTTNTTSDLIVSGAISGSNLSGTNTGNVTLGTANGLSLNVQQLSLGLASAGVTGALSGTDWSTFNNKQNALNGTGFVKISGTTISYDNSTYYLASNPSAFIALTALSGGAGISYNNTTGVITSTITQYTNAMARAALSFSAGSGAYNSTTGVITIPTDNNQIANGAGYITTETDTLASVTGRGASTSTFSAFNGGLTATKTAKNTYAIQIKGGLFGSPRVQVYDLAVDPNAYMGLGTDMSGGAYEFSNYFPRTGGNGRWSVGSWAGDFGTGQYVSGYNEKLFITESAAQFNVALTASSFIRTGGTSSQYLMADGSVSTLTNPVTGTGTTNYLPKFTGASTIGNSIIQDNSNSITVGGFALFNRASLSFLINPSYAGANVYSQLQSSGALALATGGDNNRLYIDTSGNLGLGVTPSAWISAYRAFNIGLRGFVYSRTDTQETAIGTNWYRDSNGSFLYTANGFASYQAQQDSVHYWFNAPSGTAGNAISFTQAMTLFANGNLGLGTVLPTNYTGYRTLSINNTSGGVLELKVNDVSALNIFSDSAQSYLYEPRNVPIQFYTNTTEKVRIFANGNVLIQDGGTFSNNGARLQVSGTATFSSNVTTTGGFLQFPNNYGVEGRNAANTAHRTVLKLNTSNQIEIGRDTDISSIILGTASAVNALTISSTGVATFSSSVNANATSTFSNAVSVSAIFSNGGSVNNFNSIELRGGTAGTAVNWQISKDNSFSNSFELAASTTAGGTTYGSPVFRISSTGAATFSSSVTAGGTIIASLDQGSNNQFFNLTGTQSGFAQTYSLGIVGSSRDFRIFDITANQQRLTITSGGNVGIGTIIPTARLHVVGGGTTTSISNVATTVTSRIDLANPAITLGFGYVASDIPMIQSVNNGTNNATSLTINPFGGNVLIGNTSDNGLGILQVNGNIILAGGSSSGQTQLSSGFTTLRFPNQFSSGFTDAGVKLFIFNSGSTIQGFTAGPQFDLQYHSSGSSAGRHAFYVGNQEIIRFNQTTVVSTGSITATSFFESSDATLKTLVKDNYQAKGIDSVIAKLYIKNGKEELGYFAQDLQDVLPSAVSKGSDGLLNLSYREVHTAKIAYLEERIKQLENELGKFSK